MYKVHVVVTVYDIPEDVAEKQSSVVPQGPVVIEWINRGGKRLQDAIHDAGDQTAHIRAKIQVWVLNQTLHHVQQPVQLIQIMTYRLHLMGIHDGSVI